MRTPAARPLALLGAFLVLTTALYAQASPGGGSTSRQFRGILNLATREESRRFRISVPADAYSLSLELSTPVAELSLRLWAPDGRLAGESAPMGASKAVEIHNFSRPLALQPGNYEAEVYLAVSRDPEGPSGAEFSLQATLGLVPQAQALGLGERAKGSLANTPFRLFELGLDRASNASWRLTLVNLGANLDLYILPGLVPDPRLALAESRNLHGVETITFSMADLTKAQGERPTRIYAMVAAPYDQTAQEFSLVLGEAADLPPELRFPPALTLPTVPLQRAVAATVEIISKRGGGSGCIVSPWGHVITNYHVIQEPRVQEGDLYDVAVTTDPSRPPIPAFRARVLALDRERDLALLKIDRTLGEVPLGPDYRFPWVEQRTGALPNLGEPLTTLGFPAAGGWGSRASVTLTRGVVSGFQVTGWGTVIKSDAMVGTGSSGGAALDSDFRLLGIPTEYIGRGTGQITYIYPVRAIPAAWQTLIANP